MNGWNSNNGYEIWHFVGSAADQYRQLFVTNDEWHKVLALLHPDKSVNRRKRIAKLRGRSD